MLSPIKSLALAGLLALAGTLPAGAYCGFYVAKADAKLFNHASKVVVARHGQHTAVTMDSDYQGDPHEFALVIPVPVVVAKDQIKVLNNVDVERLDAYSAPRLVEYYDPDPCAPPIQYMVRRSNDLATRGPARPAPEPRDKSLGVTIEAQYTVGEYDILILSALESDGLATWLDQSGYKMPPGAAPVLGSYIRQGMKFFVARVNLEAREKAGSAFLRPIQVSYDTAKFMLPIRLGTVNADGPQDMIVLMLTQKGRVEATNYRTVKVPSDIEVPIYTKAEFGKFYAALFGQRVESDDMRMVYTEYAWNMGFCDPCAADPLSNAELQALGAGWAVAGQPDVYITRLHVRYDARHFPEDLMFQETADRSSFQGRYILRHPYTGEAKCQAGEAYRASLGPRFEQEAATLARVTGWKLADIKARMAQSGEGTR